MRLSINLSKVELKMSKEGVTGKMGLSWMTHCMEHFGIKKMVVDEYGEKKRSNREIDAYKKIMGGVMARVAGGDRVEDIEVLRADKGLVDSLGWKEILGSDALLDFIGDRRSNGRNRNLNEAMMIKMMKKSEEEEFTYDNDATYFDSEKESAAYSYKKSKQFSGLIGSIAELGVINTMDFRPGNVSPSTGILNQLRKADSQAKQAGKRIGQFRSDSAGHQHKIFEYCDVNEIEYFISLDKNEAVMRSVEKIKHRQWKMMEGKYAKNIEQRWAETNYVTSKGFSVRILVLRWPNPDPTLFDKSPYCYHVIATNNKEIEPMEWLEVHNGRMGTIEHVNKEIKSGLGCDYAPSHDFEKNRGYFLLGILAYNMLQIMKVFYLGKEMLKSTVKTLRLRFINSCGQIIKTGRKYCCKIINVTHETFELFKNCRAKLQIIKY